MTTSTPPTPTDEDLAAFRADPLAVLPRLFETYGDPFQMPSQAGPMVLTADPDIIFLADTLCCEQTAETVSARPGWEQLRAVQAGNVVELNDDIVSRWGPRLVDFIETAGAAVAEIETAAAG